MKLKKTTIALASALLLIVGVSAAQPGDMMGRGGGVGMAAQDGHGHGDMLQRLMPMFRHLDLTDGQREQIGEIMEEARDRMESIRNSEEPMSMRDQFIDLFTSDTVTAREIEALLDSRLEMMEQANEIAAETIVAIHGVLTPEQLEMIADFEPGEMHGGMHDAAPMMHGGRQDGGFGGMNPPR